MPPARPPRRHWMPSTTSAASPTPHPMTGSCGRLGAGGADGEDREQDTRRDGVVVGSAQDGHETPGRRETEDPPERRRRAELPVGGSRRQRPLDPRVGSDGVPDREHRGGTDSAGPVTGDLLPHSGGQQDQQHDERRRQQPRHDVEVVQPGAAQLGREGMEEPVVAERLAVDHRIAGHEVAAQLSGESRLVEQVRVVELVGRGRHRRDLGQPTHPHPAHGHEHGDRRREPRRRPATAGTRASRPACGGGPQAATHSRPTTTGPTTSDGRVMPTRCPTSQVTRVRTSPVGPAQPRSVGLASPPRTKRTRAQPGSSTPTRTTASHDNDDPGSGAGRRPRRSRAPRPTRGGGRAAPAARWSRSHGRRFWHRRVPRSGTALRGRAAARLPADIRRHDPSPP